METNLNALDMHELDRLAGNMADEEKENRMQEPEKEIRKYIKLFFSKLGFKGCDPESIT